MYALLPSSVITPGYTGTPSLATSSEWGTHQPPGGASSERRNVTIYRDSLDTPWGFRLQGGKDLNTPLTVKRVFSGSPADGQLTRDDLILAIDGQPVDDLSSIQVLEKIKSAGGSIVLAIETSPYDSAFDCNLNPIRAAVHQEPVQYAPPTHQETKTSDYDSYPTSPADAVAYKASPQDYNRPTASAYHPKVTTQSRNRSANRFQATPVAPYGLSEPGWAPKAKVVAREPLTTREPSTSVPEPPASQHRSARQFNRPPGSSDSGWRSQYATVEDSNVPAWYGSLRSNRAPHTWEVRAARTQSPTYEDSQQNVMPVYQSSQNTRIEPEQIQSEQGRTYKAEIRGLMLARPAYHQAKSTPEWEDVSGRQDYRSPGQARSAPETPNAELCGRTICSDAQAADYSQQTDVSVPVRIQPSLLFGTRSTDKAVESPTQSRVTVRAQPQEMKVTPIVVGQHREATRTSGFQIVSGYKAQQPVSAPKVVTAPQVPTAARVPVTGQTKVTESASNISAPAPAKGPQRVAILPTKSEHLTGIIERFNPVPERPGKVNLIHAQKAHFSSVIERFNPTPDRPQEGQESTKPVIERFNPTPDRPGELTKSPVSASHVKFTQTPVERFNPTPEKRGQITKPPATHSQVKLSQLPVERFNPMPDRQGQPTKPKVSHLPSKLPQPPVESVSQQPVKSTKSPSSQAQTRSSLKPIERFNPTPDRPQNVIKAPATHTLEKLLIPLERFNPTPDRPLKLPRRPIERFNPVPDRP